MLTSRRLEVSCHVLGLTSLPRCYIRYSSQPQTSKDGIFHVLTTSLRDEGPKFLFKGWTPAFIRLGPNTVLLFICLEVGLVACLYLACAVVYIPFPATKEGLAPTPAPSRCLETETIHLDLPSLCFHISRARGPHP
jgi:hypothetical protein